MFVLLQIRPPRKTLSGKKLLTDAQAATVAQPPAADAAAPGPLNPLVAQGANAANAAGIAGGNPVAAIERTPDGEALPRPATPPQLDQVVALRGVRSAISVVALETPSAARDADLPASPQLPGGTADGALPPITVQAPTTPANCSATPGVGAATPGGVRRVTLPPEGEVQPGAANRNDAERGMNSAAPGEPQHSILKPAQQGAPAAVSLTATAGTAPPLSTKPLKRPYHVQVRSLSASHGRA